MIFLIEYDRRKECLVKFEKFRNSEREKAESQRLEIELNLNHKKVNHEVVLLEANSQNMLQRTHRRYFKTLKEMKDKVI